MFQSKAGIAGVAVSFVIGIVLLAMQLNISASVTSAVSSSLESNDFDGTYFKPDTSDEAPKLDMVKVAAPKSGDGKLAELEFTDEAFKGPEIILDDGTLPRDPVANSEDVAPALSEDAGFVEKVVFYAGFIWRWMLGDRPKDNSYTMSCNPKKGGGKVCTIDRGK